MLTPKLKVPNNVPSFNFFSRIYSQEEIDCLLAIGKVVEQKMGKPVKNRETFLEMMRYFAKGHGLEFNI